MHDFSLNADIVMAYENLLFFKDCIWPDNPAEFEAKLNSLKNIKVAQHEYEGAEAKTAYDETSFSLKMLLNYLEGAAKLANKNAVNRTIFKNCFADFIRSFISLSASYGKIKKDCTAKDWICSPDSFPAIKKYIKKNLPDLSNKLGI
jgi:hypothetical protein